jgi:tetratricopeptide (TPR) repeat protein
LVVQVLHGIMDDAMYGNHGTPLLFLLPGVAVAFGAKYGKPRPAEQRLRRRIFALSSLALILIAFAATSGRTSAGIWYSNLGAVAMAKVELADWPTNQWSEGDYGNDLSESAGLFTRALRLDPENVTAYHRLGLIAMHRRDFSQAASLLRNAHARDRHHRGIAKSLAYSALWAGQSKEAAVLLVAFPESRRELEAYSHWWKLHGREDLAASAASMVAHLSSLISDPS